ncbi:MAG: ATP-grasp domain-containing protein [Reinekea sp.]|jgi:predicted ATP-grasp superfamily ATP-dependent carboligase
MDSMPVSILVMDANQRSALAVTRALGATYPGCKLVTADETTNALAGKSRYSAQYLQHPSPGSNPKEFLEWVKNSHLERFDLIVPTTEITSQTLLLHLQELPDLALPFADIKTIMQLADKGNLVRTAMDIGIPVPESRFFKNADGLSNAQINYPVVLKPTQSRYFINNSWISASVRILHSKEDLEQALKRDTYLKTQPFMLQQFIEGSGAGLFCLFDQGRPVQYFSHKRLREKPPEGGVSVLSQAQPVAPQLKAISEQLLRKVNWHGVAMVEFRIALDGTPYLMEVNTRFWGSLQLAIDAGVNFPAQLASVYFKQPVQTVETYNTDQRLRWLMGDIDSLYIYLKRSHSIADKFRRLLAFCTPRFKNQKHEINRLSDIKPFLEELKQYFS